MIDGGAASIRWDADPNATRALRIAAMAAAIDGHAPFNDQMIVDIKSGAASVGILTVDGTDMAAAATVGTSFELVVDPAARRRGLGTQLGRVALTRCAADGMTAKSSSGAEANRVTAWSHGTGEAATRLAARLSMTPARRIHVLAATQPHQTNQTTERDATPSISIHTIDDTAGGRDAARDEWVRLNATAFASHPEQGTLTRADLNARTREQWWDPEGFFIARNAAGEALGFCWTKIVTTRASETVGEIYAIGVLPNATGHGIGTTLLDTGLCYLQHRGVVETILYVDDNNTRAIDLYRANGFTHRSTDTQYISGKIEP